MINKKVLIKICERSNWREVSLMTVARGATAVPLGKLIIIPHGNTEPIWPTVVIRGNFVVLIFE